MDKIATKRLLLRPLKNDDSLDVFEYAKLENVGPDAGWTPHKSLEESKRVLEWMIGTNEVYAIYHQEDEKVIGTIGLHKKDYPMHQAEIGYVLHPLYWNRGYMTEAVTALITYVFEETDITLLHCAHFNDNERSQRVINKSGFNKVKEELKTITLYGFSITKQSVKYELPKANYERKMLPWQQH